MLDAKIETFLTICKHMNFTKAAEELHMTQPAVSSQMKKLEEHYGMVLFQYENKKLSLTAAGKAVQEAVQRMENQEGYLQQQLRFMENKRRDIHFGATMTIGEFMLADSIAAYLEQYPDSSLHMEVANTEHLLRQLDEGILDFAFIEGNFSKKEYRSDAFHTSRFIPVCGDRRLIEKGPLELQDLFGSRLIVREAGSGTRDIFESQLRGQNHDISEFPSIVEIGNMNAIKDLLLRKVGISFLYEDVVRKELEEQKLFEIPLQDWKVSHRMNLVWRKENEYLDPVEDFLRMFRK